MCQPSEGHLGGHGVEPRAVLARKLTQVITISGDNRIKKAVPFGLRQRGEIGLADAFQLLAARLATDGHGLALIRGGIDHTLPPVADVLAGAGAEVLAAVIALRVGEAIVWVEPTKPTRLPVADGAEAGAGLAHGSNLYPEISK